MMSVPSMAVTLYTFPSENLSTIPTNVIDLSSPDSVTTNGTSDIYASKSDVGLSHINNRKVFVAVDKPGKSGKTWSGSSSLPLVTFTYSKNIKATNAGSYKNVTIKIKVTKIKLNALASSVTMEKPDWKVCVISQGGGSGFAVGSLTNNSEYTYGNSWQAPMEVSLVIEITGINSEEREQLIYACFDMDQVSNPNNNIGAREGVSFDSSFDEFTWWPNHQIRNDGNKFYAPSDLNTDGNDRWFKSGVIAHPSSSEFAVTHYCGGNMSTGVTIYTCYTERPVQPEPIVHFNSYKVKLLKESTDEMVSDINFKVTGKTNSAQKIDKEVTSNESGEILIEGLQAGDYVIEETGFDSAKYINMKEVSGCSYPAIKFSITDSEPDGKLVDLTNGGTNEDFIFENIRKPEITTSFVGECNDHISIFGEGTALTDYVSYKNLKPNGQYTLKTSFHDSDTGEQVGKQLSRDFIPQSSDGTESVEVTMNTSACAGRSLVAFEELWYKGILIGEHKDLGDADQTVVFPEITTEASSNLTDEDIIKSGKICITDTLHNYNLLSDKEYIIKTYLCDKSTGEKIEGIEATNTLSTAIKTNPPEASGHGLSTDYDVEIKGDLSGLEGKEVVVYEELYLNDVPVVKHTDINNEDQTVQLPQNNHNQTLQPTKVNPIQPSQREPVQTGDNKRISLLCAALFMALISLLIVQKIRRQIDENFAKTAKHYKR